MSLINNENFDNIICCFFKFGNLNSVQSIVSQKNIASRRSLLSFSDNLSLKSSYFLHEEQKTFLVKIFPLNQ